MKIDETNYKKYIQALNVQMFCINNQFDKAVTLSDIAETNINLTKIYEVIMQIQMFLIENKELLPAEEFSKHQQSINSLFKYYEFLEIKFKNAKHIMFNLAKKGDITSEKDSILFTADDDLLHN